MNIHPVVAEFFHAEGQQTDSWAEVMKERVAFRNFTKAPKNQLNLYTETIPVCSVSNTYTKHVNALRVGNVHVCSWR